MLAADARAEGLDKDPVLARQIATQVDKLLAQAKVERIEAAAAAEFDKSADKCTARARELYEVNRAKYGVPETGARGAHPGDDQGRATSDAALAKAKEIRAKAVAGERLREARARIFGRPNRGQEWRRTRILRGQDDGRGIPRPHSR